MLLRSSISARRCARTTAAATLAIAGLVAFSPAVSARPEVIEEEGFVAFCTGEADSFSATVDLYQNSIVEVPPSLIIEDSAGTVLVGTGTTTGDIFDNGTVDVDFSLMNLEDESPAGSASVTGTYSVVGQPRRVHEVLRDAGDIVVITGTNIQLDTDLTLTYAATTIPLTCDPAFAFDLTTRRQPIGNG